MNVVNGADVIILFKKEGGFFPFVCATDMDFITAVDVVGVRTQGDGKWAKSRSRKFSYSITLSGIVTHIGLDINSFFLQDAMLQGYPIEYRAIWDDPESNLRRVISGTVIITNSSLPSAAEGFATSTFTLIGDGPYTIADSAITCTGTIATVDVTSYDPGGPGAIQIQFTGKSANTVRIDYEIDGNGRDSILTPSGTSGFIRPTGNYGGMHTVVLYPICENGEDGVSIEKTFTI